MEANIHMKFNFKEDGKRIIVICAVSVMTALNIKTFVRTGGLIPGGVTGLTLLIQRVVEMFFGFELPFTVINLMLNLIPVYIGFRYIGKKFTMYSCLCIMLTNILTDMIPSHAIVYDTLLISVFGGMINGFAISMCLMVNATTGGTDFISIFLAEKTGMDSFNVILGFNAVLLVIVGLLFGWEKALYSIIFQYASTQVLRTLFKQYRQHTLLVVTNRAKQVHEVIFANSNHGATVIEAEGSYEHQERKIVYSVVSRAECKSIIKEIKHVDPDAFVNVINTQQISGRFYQRPYE